MTDSQAPEELRARFEELGALEAEFEDIESEIIRKADALHAPLYKKRADYVAKIPHFWSLVFEQAPNEIETFIKPSDSKVFAECLDTFEVSRFEIDDPKGSPRSFSLKFGFKENEYFEDSVLEKKFWFRKTRDWVGLVSEPVKINWKKGQDLTAGLTDAAYSLGEFRKKSAIDTSSAEARKKETESKEYQQLAQMIEAGSDASMSFFGIFGFVSGFRWVSAEENEKTIQEDNERLRKIRQGETVEDEDDDDDEDLIDFQECEVFPSGDELATIIAEDMWPNAIKYYKQTFEEEDDEDLSDLDEIMDDSDEAGQSQEDDSEGDQEVDIRALVGKGRKSAGEPPAKKQRKT